jgi:flagellar biosynthetic protein FliS
MRAHAVLSELRLALDHQQAPELAEQLTTLYEFAEGGIRQAITDEDAQALAPVRDVLNTLLDGWKRLEVQS